MISGKVSRTLLTQIRSEFQNRDMFQSMLVHLLTMRLSSSVQYEYNRVGNNFNRRVKEFKFFGHADD